MDRMNTNARQSGLFLHPVDLVNPVYTRFILPTYLQADMPLLKRKGSGIRTYSVTNYFDQIIGLAKQAGLKAIPAIIRCEAICQITGMHRNTPQCKQIVLRISESAIPLPVTTSEPWPICCDHPALGNSVATLCIKVFPSGETQAQPIENLMADPVFFMGCGRVAVVAGRAVASPCQQEEADVTQR